MLPSRQRKVQQSLLVEGWLRPSWPVMSRASASDRGITREVKELCSRDRNDLPPGSCGHASTPRWLLISVRGHRGFMCRTSQFPTNAGLGVAQFWGLLANCFAPKTNDWLEFVWASSHLSPCAGQCGILKSSEDALSSCPPPKNVSPCPFIVQSCNTHQVPELSGLFRRALTPWHKSFRRLNAVG